MTGLEAFYMDSKAEGKAEGKAESLLLTTKIIKLHTRNVDAAAIAEKIGTDLDFVNAVITEYESDND